MRERLTSKRVTRLQRMNLQNAFIMVLTSLEMKMTQFVMNFLSVFQMVIMVNWQGSTIKAIQLLLNIDICSGM